MTPDRPFSLEEYDERMGMIYRQVRIIFRTFQLVWGDDWSAELVTPFKSAMGFTLRATINVVEMDQNAHPEPEIMIGKPFERKWFAEMIVGFDFCIKDPQAPYVSLYANDMLVSRAKINDGIPLAPVYDRYWYPVERLVCNTARFGPKDAGKRIVVLTIRDPVIAKLHQKIHAEPHHNTILRINEPGGFNQMGFHVGRSTGTVEILHHEWDHNKPTLQYPLHWIARLLQKASRNYLHRLQLKPLRDQIETRPGGRQYEDALERHTSDTGQFKI